MKHLKAILAELEQKLGPHDRQVADVRREVIEGETVQRAHNALTWQADVNVPVVQLEFDVHERLVALVHRHAEVLAAWQAIASSSDRDARHAAAIAEAHAHRTVLLAVHDALPDMLVHEIDAIGQIRNMLAAAWLVESNHFGRT